MSHLITKVQILEARLGMDRPPEILTKSRILVHRNRLQDEVNIVVANRGSRARRSSSIRMPACKELYDLLLRRDLPIGAKSCHRQSARIEAGTRMRLTDGKEAEILQGPGDSIWGFGRILENGSAAGSDEDTIFAQDTEIVKTR